MPFEQHEFPSSKTSFTYIKKIAGHYGIDINDHIKHKIYAKLARRLRYLQLPDFDAYCQQLKMNPEEEKKFINLITNLSTYFFREKYHFEYLKQNLLPELLEKKIKFVFGLLAAQLEKKLIQPLLL